MAYPDFTLERLTRDFGVDFQGADLFAGVPSVMPSDSLLQSLDQARRAGYGSDRARTERLVSPLLLEVVQRNDYTFGFVSGQPLDVDPARGLVGECDLGFTHSLVPDFIQAPFFLLVGASTHEDGHELARCVAQLLAAAELNARHPTPRPGLFGATTTGIEWRFLKLENQLITIDPTHYLTWKTPQLLGVLQGIVDQCRPSAQQGLKAD